MAENLRQANRDLFQHQNVIFDDFVDYPRQVISQTRKVRLQGKFRLNPSRIIGLKYLALSGCRSKDAQSSSCRRRNKPIFPSSFQNELRSSTLRLLPRYSRPLPLIPDGHIFQVEYAGEAVKRGSSAVHPPSPCTLLSVIACFKLFLLHAYLVLMMLTFWV
jgi:hypothetical protein